MTNSQTKYVRNEVEASLVQKKREFTENYFNNQTRIDQNQLRSLNGISNLAFSQQSQQIQPISAVLRETHDTLYSLASTNLAPLQPAQLYNHHHYVPQQTANAHLPSSMYPLR